MKSSKIWWVALLSVGIFWLAHALIQSLLAEGISFRESLILQIPPDDMVFRLFIVTAMAVKLVLLYFKPWRYNRDPGVYIHIPESRTNHLQPATRTRINRFVHEIRTQLNNIVGFSQLLDNPDTTDKEKSWYLHYIDNSKRNMSRAADELYAYHKSANRKETKPRNGKISNANRWKSKNILIVDDVETNFLILKMALQRTGAGISWAKNGKIAVEMFRDMGNVDLVLMDILMPEMDGFEATRKIKQLRPDVPVIAQTAYSYDEMSLNHGAAPFDGYLIKPIWQIDLFNKCAKYLDN